MSKESKALVSYEIGSSVPENGIKIITDFVHYKEKELRFLEEYAKDLDVFRALKEVGYKDPNSAWKHLQKKLHIKQEMAAIAEARFKALRMTSEMAASKHLELMQKIEEDYDSSDLQTKAKFANSLSKFSGDYLRGAGLFGGQKTTAPSVVVNINVGNAEEEIKPAVIIENEVIE